MGSTKSISEAIIGEIIMEGQKATLLVASERPTKFSIIVQDKTGKSCFEDSFAIEAGEQTLGFQFDQLKSGNFDAWIETDGKTFIRSFSIIASKGKGVFHNLKNPFW